MMQSPSIFKKRSILFKRWSHKGYAAFAGLHRHIIIGRLQAADCVVAMLKNGVQTFRSLPQTFGQLRKEEDDDIGRDIGIPAMLSSLISSSIMTIDAPQVAYCPSISVSKNIGMLLSEKEQRPDISFYIKTQKQHLS